MSQPIRRRKRLWTNISAPTPAHPNGVKTEKYRDTVTVMPGGTEEYRDGWERTFGKAKRSVASRPSSIEFAMSPEGQRRGALMSEDPMVRARAAADLERLDTAVSNEAGDSGAGEEDAVGNGGGMSCDNETKFYAALLGSRVLEVNGTTLVLSNGKSVQFGLDGGCCSVSSFTDKAQFQELKGSVLQKIEERDGAAGVPGRIYEQDDSDQGYISWHFLVFETDKGHVTIDWRNDSNGFYDGTVKPRVFDTLVVEAS